MAKKKSIEDRKAEIENLQKMLEEAKKNEIRERENLTIRVFSPVFFNEEICSFCDKNQKSKEIMDCIKDEVEQAIFSVIEAIDTGKFKVLEEKIIEKGDFSLEKDSEEESKKTNRQFDD